ncbi:MAG: hypothetical protein AAFY17_01070, partial [Cyanobacteria bacterium J06642_11]
MSLASAFTLSRLSADLTYDLNRSSEVPEDLAVQCAVSRGKIMVLLESPQATSVPADHVFAQVESSIRHRLEIDGLPVEANALGAEGEPIPIKVYLKQLDLSKPSAVHQFSWLLRDGAPPPAVDGTALGDQLNDRTLEPLLNRQPEFAPDILFDGEDDDDFDDDDITADLSAESLPVGQERLFGEDLDSADEMLSGEDISVDELLNLEGL